MGEHDRNDQPSTSSAKYSAGRPSAISESGGANKAIGKVARVPAMNEPIAAVASALPARPATRHGVTVERRNHREEASPGRFTRIAVVEPPYCAP